MKKARSLPCPKSLILLVEQRGIEPLTSALRTRRSAKLSYCPTRVCDFTGRSVGCQVHPHLRNTSFIAFSVINVSAHVSVENGAVTMKRRSIRNGYVYFDEREQCWY